MLHIYTGNGKGKTTAAVGLAVRAAGAGMRVCFVQFLKNGTSSEIAMLEKLGVTVMYTEGCQKFTFQMNEEELADLTEEHKSLVREAGRLVISDKIDMLVLDEFIAAYNKELLDQIIAERLISDAMSHNCEIVLTGRNAPEKLCSLADYITVMQPEKHPYNKGIGARKGIEY